MQFQLTDFIKVNLKKQPNFVVNFLSYFFFKMCGNVPISYFMFYKYTPHILVGYDNNYLIACV